MVLDRNVLFALSYSMSRKSWLLLQPVSNCRLAGMIMTVRIARCSLRWRRSVKENCYEIDVYIYSWTLRDNYHCVNLYLVFKKCVFCSLRYFDIHIIKPVILLWMKLMHLFRWKRNKGDRSTPQKVSVQNNNISLSFSVRYSNVHALNTPVSLAQEASATYSAYGKLVNSPPSQCGLEAVSYGSWSLFHNKELL